MLKDLSPDQILSLAFIGSHIGGIAHNINTPLSAIMGRMELLQMRLGKIRMAAGTALDTELEKCFNDLSIISQCCAKVDDTLKNSVQTCSGILENQRSGIQLDALLKSVLAFLNADMEFKHQTVKTFDFNENIFVKVRSTGRLIEAKFDYDKKQVTFLKGELGVSPGQACVFYKPDLMGVRVLGGGWIKATE